MAYTFSFLGEPLENILDNVYKMFPYLEKAIAIYFSEKFHGLRLLEKSENSISEQKDFSGMHDSLHSLRKEKAEWNWINKSRLPFESVPTANRQFSIYDEENNTILLMRIKNPVDHLSDLLIFYFNRNASQFFLSGKDNTLSAEHKSIIANMAYNTVKAALETDEQNRNAFEHFSFYTLQKTNNLKQEVETHRTEKEKSFNEILNYCEEILNALSRKHQRNFVLTETAKEKIKKEANIKKIRPVLFNTVDYLNLIHRFDAGLTIMIEESDLNFDMKTEMESVSSSRDMSPRMIKTEFFMDEFEEAAKKALNANGQVTIRNVGQHMPNKISAPAISDRIKNYKKYIAKLLHEKPEKWKVIRHELYPIRKIVSESRFNKQDII